MQTILPPITRSQSPTPRENPAPSISHGHPHGSESDHYTFHNVCMTSHIIQLLSSCLTVVLALKSAAQVIYTFLLPPFQPHLHIPKTFTTRKGALLLFSEDFANKHHASRKRLKRLHHSAEGPAIHTVDDLARSILAYGATKVSVHLRKVRL